MGNENAYKQEALAGVEVIRQGVESLDERQCRMLLESGALNACVRTILALKTARAIGQTTLGDIFGRLFTKKG